MIIEQRYIRYCTLSKLLMPDWYPALLMTHTGTIVVFITQFNYLNKLSIAFMVLNRFRSRIVILYSYRSINLGKYMKSMRNTTSQVFSHQPERPFHFSELHNIQNHKDCITNGIENQHTYQKSPFQQSSQKYQTSDSIYNDKIYAWRARETGPIVKVFSIKKIEDVHPVKGSKIFQNIVNVEKIQSRINQLQHFSIEQALYILSSMVQGYQIIYKKLGAVSVSLEKCGINPQGQIKVWVNEQLFRNDISGEILSSEHAIVSRILNILEPVTISNSKHFWEYVNSALEHSKQQIKKKKKLWTFNLIKAIINSFVKCLHIKLPTKLDHSINNKHCLYRRRSCEEQAKKYLEIKCANMQSSIFFNHPELRNQPNGVNENVDQRTIGLMNNSKPLKSSLTNHTNKSIKRRITTTTCSSNNRFISERSMNQHQRHSSSIANLNIETLQNNVGNAHKFPRNKDHRANKTEIKQQFQESQQQNPPDLMNNIMTSAHQLIYGDKMKKKSRKYRISQQYQYQIQSQSKDILNNSMNGRILSLNSHKEKSKDVKAKTSLISTTNQSSFKAPYGLRGFKDSIMTLGLDERSRSKENRSRNHSYKQKNQYKDSKEKAGEIKEEEKGNRLLNMNNKKKIQYSCTNWRGECCDLQQEPVKKDGESQLKENISELLQKNSFLVKKPILESLKILSEHQLESYETTEHNSEPISTDKQPEADENQQRKILEKIANIRENLFVSTYLDASSDPKLSSSKIVQEVVTNSILTSTMLAKIKEEEVLEGNCWTKRLEGLVGSALNLNSSQLKESISCGEETTFYKGKQIKLSMLGKLGREIGRSVIPEELIEL